MKKIIIAAAVFLLSGIVFASENSGESLLNSGESWYRLNLSAESGMLIINSHIIQFGQTGTRFDYKEEGNQDVLFPFLRFTASLRLFETHSVVFLYQPLDINTKAVAERDLAFYTTTFLTGTVLNVKYGFSFYRMSYVWYFLKDGNNELGIGLSLQLRNASIIFEAADGSDIIINENVGPVPIIKVAGNYEFENGVWVGLDADGFYAAGEVFNGASYPFEGAIWDISARCGIKLKNGISPFLNLRYLGGGARGTSQGEDARGDGYTENWLDTYSITLGVNIN